MNTNDNAETKKLIPGLGERVKECRTRLALSLQVAATRGGITTNTWTTAERHDLATTRTLNRVARALGVEVDVLTGRKAGDP